MSHTIEPVALIIDTLFGIVVLSFSVPEPILNLAFVGGFIRPGVLANASDLVVLELPFVLRAIGPLEFSVFAVK